MKERPMLFSAPMIRAILNGSKTQTRRVVKFPNWLERGNKINEAFPVSTATSVGRMPYGFFFYNPDGKGGGFGSACPHGQIGDRIWVKENVWRWCEKIPNGKTKTGRDKFKYVALPQAQVFYKLDHPNKPLLEVVSPSRGYGWGWRMKVGRFMPRAASRITLEIVGVSVERLQDISEEDAKAEGVENICPFYSCNGSGIIDVQDNHCRCAEYNPKDVYEWLWKSIHGNRSWKKNPWVWKIEFKHLTK